MSIFLLYVPCENTVQAKAIGKHLLEKKLCACVNIFPEMISLYSWPLPENIEEGKEVLLLVKTTKEKAQEAQREIERLHNYKTPCILGFPVPLINAPYENWIKETLSS